MTSLTEPVTDDDTAWTTSELELAFLEGVEALLSSTYAHYSIILC